VRLLGYSNSIRGGIHGGMLLSGTLLRQLSVARLEKRPKPYELEVGHARISRMCVW